MLLQALQPTLCQLGLHNWQHENDDEASTEEVQYCARCGATKVTLQPGQKNAVVGQIEIALIEDEEKLTTAKEQEER